jgi:hypothetical protein
MVRRLCIALLLVVPATVGRGQDEARDAVATEVKALMA